jgi:translation elongation factor EF-Ts
MYGTVVSYMHHDKRGGAMVEIITETDFAANSQEIADFGRWVAMIAYGFNLPSWDYFLASEVNLNGTTRLEDLKKVIKENVRVGRITVLKVA